MKHRFPWHRIDPSLPPAEYDAATVAKIKSRCRILDNGCWEFLGTRNDAGYGQYIYRGQRIATHRIMHQLVNGPIPDDHYCCHRCDFPPCCNPAHTFGAPPGANTADMLSKGRHYKQANTHCPRGHSFEEHGRVDGGRKRSCRACERAKLRIYAGWPEDLAYSAPAGYVGQVPEGLVRVTPPKRNITVTCWTCLFGAARSQSAPDVVSFWP